MTRKIKIEGSGHQTKIFLDDKEVHPTCIEISMKPDDYRAVLYFEDIDIEVDSDFDKVEELTEKISVKPGRE